MGPEQLDSLRAVGAVDLEEIRSLLRHEAQDDVDPLLENLDFQVVPGFGLQAVGVLLPETVRKEAAASSWLGREAEGK